MARDDDKKFRKDERRPRPREIVQPGPMPRPVRDVGLGNGPRGMGLAQALNSLPKMPAGPIATGGTGVGPVNTGGLGVGIMNQPGNPGFPDPTTRPQTPRTGSFLDTMKSMGVAGGMKKGGKVKAKPAKKMASGGKTSSASKRGDGCAIKGKTKGKMV